MACKCFFETREASVCSESSARLLELSLDRGYALTKHPVKGTTAAVRIVDESKNTLCTNKIEHFSSFHNFEYGDIGLRVWKCYGIGKGKYIPYDVIYIKHHGQTSLQTIESQGFYDPLEKRVVKRRSKGSKETESTTPLFECSVFGRVEVFETFSQLELHLDVGKHTVSRLRQYDAIKRDWALKFSSIDTAGIECSSCSLDSSTPLTSPVDTSPHSSLRTGWAVSKPRGSVRFSEKVKEYLTARFTLGERTGRKADPAQVAVDMRNAKNESNARLFTREQWLTKSQVQSFFSRLAAMRRKDQGVIGISLDEEEDIQCVQENSER